MKGYLHILIYEEQGSIRISLDRSNSLVIFKSNAAKYAAFYDLLHSFHVVTRHYHHLVDFRLRISACKRITYTVYEFLFAHSIQSFALEKVKFS